MDAEELEKTHLNTVIESLVSRMEDLKNVGLWKILSGEQRVNDDNTVELSELHDTYPMLLELAATNPWHIRGVQLRHSYIFGNKFEIEGVGPSSKAFRIINKPQNRNTLFSVDAMDTNNLSMFTAGNMIMLYDEIEQVFTRVPLKEIDSVSTDPDNRMNIWYVRRTWTSMDRAGNDRPQSVWYPVAQYKSERKELRKTLGHGADQKPVDKNTVAFIKHSRRPEGSTWGIPDSLGAVIWTVAYSEYLGDNAKLVKALSRFAWNITRPDKSAVRRTASEVHDAPGGIGDSAVSAGGGVSTVGVPSAQVNMNNGQPLISAVAASFGVPVIALLSSPGATGGSYGAASTLDQPTVKGFEVLQDSWAEFYEGVLNYLGSKNARVVFPPIQTDPPHRVMAALGVGVAQGLIWREDASDFAYSLMGIRRTKNGLPPVPNEKDPAPVPGGVQQGETDHSLDDEG